MESNLSTRLIVLLLITSLGLSGCSSLPSWANPGTWFINKEKLERKRLDPINEEFEVEKLWSKDIGKGVKGYFSKLRPAYAYDTLYVAERHGKVVAFNPENGKRLWVRNFAKFEKKGFFSFSFITRLWQSGESAKIGGGLGVAYEKVFFGTENGDVYALDAKTGKTIWHERVKGEVLAEPAIDAGIVAFNTGAGTLFALDAETGEERWTFESEVPPLSLRGVSAPVAESGGIITGTATGRLVVIIAETGQIAWEQVVGKPTGGTELQRIIDIDGKPLVLAGIAYVISYDGTLAAVELRSGRIVWSREYKSSRRISIDGNNLFVVDADSNIYALDRRNGTELWSLGELNDREVTAAQPVSDFIVVGDRYGIMHWIDQSDGAIVARAKVGGNDKDESIFVTPVVEGNTVYTQTRRGKVVALLTP
jgi:outer membrane protein assembly factor BamB